MLSGWIRLDALFRRLTVACGVAVISLIAVTTAEASRWKVGNDGCYWDENDEGPDQCDPNAPTGRYKLDANGCYWEPNDSGPNQCEPYTGRYKFDGSGGCYWEPNDSGPHQCDPNAPPPPPPTGRWKWDGQYCFWSESESGPNQCDLETPPGDPPLNDGNIAGTEMVQGLLPGQWDGQTVQVPLPPQSCAAHVVNGNAGYIAIQVDPVSGFTAWGAYMHKWWHNFGLWHTEERRNGIVMENGIKNQFYPPHGSRAPTSLPPGSLFRLDVIHAFFDWGIIYVPPFGVVGTWIPKVAYGAAQCLR